MCVCVCLYVCSEEVAQSFISRVFTHYKKLGIAWDDAHADVDRPTDLTQTMQACRATLSVVDPLTFQDCEVIVQCSADFRQMTNSMLSDLHVCIMVADDAHMKGLFNDIYENAVAYKFECAKLKESIDMIEHAER